MPKASRLSSLPEALVQFCNKWLVGVEGAGPGPHKGWLVRIRQWRSGNPGSSLVVAYCVHNIVSRNEVHHLVIGTKEIRNARKCSTIHKIYIFQVRLLSTEKLHWQWRGLRVQISPTQIQNAHGIVIHKGSRGCA